MEILDNAVHMVAGQDAEAVWDAAVIWAGARARRDHEPEPVAAEETMPGIRRRLALDGATLLRARRDGRCVGFALFAPRPQTLEIFYLAVAPDSWTGGIGSRLLLDVENHAREIGCATLELWVISDNERAIRVYEKYGFAGTGEESEPPNGRPERRFVKHLGPGGAGARRPPTG